jgi:putative NADPH-quinone reductase
MRKEVYKTKHPIVFAHPENENSFQKSLRDHFVAQLHAAGHEVKNFRLAHSL